MDKIESLRLLIEVAELGSFSAVARSRAVAVSTVTLAIEQLEQRVGTRLITRSTRQLIFTHEGQRLLEGARRIVGDWETVLSELRQDGKLQGPIRITASNDFGRRCLAPIVDTFMQLHPGLHVFLQLSDAVLDIVEHQLDFAIRSGPLVDSQFKARLLLVGRRLVCAAPQYWDRRGRPQHPAELMDHNCLVLARYGASQTAWPFVVGGKKVFISVKGDRMANDGGLIREWAIQGRGVMVKNAWDIRSELATGKLEPVLEDFVAEKIDLYAVYPKTSPSKRAMVFLEYLTQQLNKNHGYPDHVQGTNIAS